MKKATQKKKKKGARGKPEAASTIKSNSNNRAVSDRQEKEAQRKARPVVARKDTERREEDRGTLLRSFRMAGQFLRECRMELKKVKWPTRKELLASTAMVIFLVLFLSLYLGLIDFGLIKLIKNIVG